MTDLAEMQAALAKLEIALYNRLKAQGSTQVQGSTGAPWRVSQHNRLEAPDMAQGGRQEGPGSLLLMAFCQRVQDSPQYHRRGLSRTIGRNSLNSLFYEACQLQLPVQLLHHRRDSGESSISSDQPYLLK